jgi:hypothetical protein
LVHFAKLLQKVKRLGQERMSAREENDEGRR